MPSVELILASHSMLGECPRWSTAEQCLYWVDIARCELHRFDPATGEDRSRVFDQPVGCFALRRQGGFVLAMRDCFALLDDFEGRLRCLPPVIDALENRFNDGRCDNRGRFWAGSMDGTRQRGNGTLYRLDPDLTVHEMATGAVTANGLAFSPDDATLYWSDSPRRVVYAYDFNVETGEIANRRVFAGFAEGAGRPDGASVDVAGCYWSGLYDGGKVVRFAPDGALLEEIPIPARHCTMIAFGGADLKTAFVTTARQQLSETDLQTWPQSGGLFQFRVAVPGLPEHEFAG